MSDLVERLKVAVEGECEGLAITDEQALAILEYVLGEDEPRQAARITELEAALARARAWHESEDKALSKSGRSDREYHWMRCQHRDQIDDFRSVQPDVQYNAAWDAMNARAALAGKGDDK